MDLLTQEALVADIADWLVIFAESVGSFCELGAFAAMPHSVSITSVVVAREHKNDKSFLLNGPVKVISNSNAPLSKVFFADLNCPLTNVEFENFVLGIRDQITESEDCSLNRSRKSITKLDREPIFNEKDKVKERGSNASYNKRPTLTIQVGSFAHELLDLISLFSPISEKDLIWLYDKIKGINRRTTNIELISPALNDMHSNVRISSKHVLAIMLATGLIGAVGDSFSQESLYFSKVSPTSFFMFKKTEDQNFNEVRAEILLKKRRRKRSYARNFYYRFNAD